MMLRLLHICLYFAGIFAEENQRPPNVLFIVADDLGKILLVDTFIESGAGHNSAQKAFSIKWLRFPLGSCVRALITGGFKLVMY